MAWILGIKGGGGWHNSGVALLNSDTSKIYYSSEEERFCNDKKTSMWPTASIQAALASENLTSTDISHVGFPMSYTQFSQGYIKNQILPASKVNDMSHEVLGNALNVLHGKPPPLYPTETPENVS